MLKIKALLLYFYLSPALLFAQQHYDLILKNGKIIDGTQAIPGFMAMWVL
jgi:hypothetical protein